MDRQCTAKSKSTGQRCGKYAMKGQTVCSKHGGGAPGARKAAARRIEEARLQDKARKELRRLGEPTSGDPGEILLSLVREKAGEVAWLRVQVEALEAEALTWGVTKTVVGSGPNGPVDTEERGAQQHILYGLYHKAQDQLANYASAALRAGIEERQVRVAEQTAHQFTRILTSLQERLDLTSEQSGMWDRVVADVVRAELEQ